MKKISIVIPTYNEVENIEYGYNRVLSVINECTDYKWEILYIDNFSTDGTRALLKGLATKDSRVKVILNAVNVGWSKSSFYGILNTTGDAVVLLAADMQEPPELISKFLEKYEEGNRIVIGKKTTSQENRIKYLIRKIYYWLLRKTSEIDHIDQFMGFGLYDKSFVDVLRKLDDPMPYLRGMVAELGGERAEIEYEQENRKKGKTHFNFWGMYDLAMLGITSYTKVIMRFCTIIGCFVGIVCVGIAIITFFLKIFNVVDFVTGMAALIVSNFFLGALTLFFIGLLGEYIININCRVMNRPLVIEEQRIGFDEEDA